MASNWRQIPMVDFSNLTLPDKPNYSLVSDQPAAGKRQIKAPVFPISLDELKLRWLALVRQQPRIMLLRAEPEKQQYQYVQKSFLFRFPDVIDVQFVRIDDNNSTLRTFSRSVYGHFDFGVNHRRLRNWLIELNGEESA